MLPSLTSLSEILIITKYGMLFLKEGDYNMSSDKTVNQEIREEQKRALSTMSFKEKLAYFWDYYKIHTLAVIGGIALVVSFVHQIAANKPYAFYAMLLNAATGEENADTSALWESEFLEFAGIDAEAYRVCIDTTLSISAESNSQYEMANRQKIVAMMYTGDIHAIVADTETFESYARADTFYNLSDIFTEEELAPYTDLFYYTDAAAFNEESGNTLTEMEAAEKAFYAKVIDHGDPSAMEKPIPVGIRIPTSGNKMADAGYYRYLQDNDLIFQGYPSETVLGIPLSVKDPKVALQFLSYLNIN